MHTVHSLLNLHQLMAAADRTGKDYFSSHTDIFSDNNM